VPATQFSPDLSFPGPFFPFPWRTSLSPFFFRCQSVFEGGSLRTTYSLFPDSFPPLTLTPSKLIPPCCYENDVVEHYGMLPFLCFPPSPPCFSLTCSRPLQLEGMTPSDPPLPFFRRFSRIFLAFPTLSFFGSCPRRFELSQY